MKTALRTLRLLALIVWVGALTFFGVVAYVAFTRLPSTHDAGIVVGGSLRMLHRMGMVCGGVLIATSLSLARTRRVLIFSAITAVMLALTAYSQYSILPRMEADRIAAAADAESFKAPPSGTPMDRFPQEEFDLLHKLSVRIEQAVLLGGLVLTVMLAQRED